MKPTVGQVMEAVHTYVVTLQKENRENPDWWMKPEQAPVDKALLNVRRMVETLSDGEVDSWYCTCPEPMWWWDEDAFGKPIRACEICDKAQSPQDAVADYEAAMAAEADAAYERGRE